MFNIINEQRKFVCDSEDDLETILTDADPAFLKPGLLALVPIEDEDDEDNKVVCTWVLGNDLETWYKLANVGQAG